MNNIFTKHTDITWETLQFTGQWCVHFRAYRNHRTHPEHERPNRREQMTWQNAWTATTLQKADEHKKRYRHKLVGTLPHWSKELGAISKCWFWHWESCVNVWGKYKQGPLKIMQFSCAVNQVLPCFCAVPFWGILKGLKLCIHTETMESVQNFTHNPYKVETS